MDIGEEAAGKVDTGEVIGTEPATIFGLATIAGEAGAIAGAGDA